MKPGLFSKPITTRQIILYGIVWTVLLELLTVMLRFGFSLESSRHTASTVGILTMGLRIHHGYIGFVMLIAAWFFKSKPIVFAWILILGIALFASDMIHHFLVLWPITGSPQFHLVYPY
ncbi:MAG: hypothetical protein CMJ19_08715 [Phycisphaeraceae bacterium]|nr:hypothetical protein [Phycisphaeraceae bacterium]